MSACRRYGASRCAAKSERSINKDAARAADRAAYLAKFPDAEPVTALGDFAFFRLEISGGRVVSGFSGAVNLPARALPSLLAFSVPS